jgi:hypothetical protein
MIAVKEIFPGYEKTTLSCENLGPHSQHCMGVACSVVNGALPAIPGEIYIRKIQYVLAQSNGNAYSIALIP